MKGGHHVYARRSRTSLDVTRLAARVGMSRSIFAMRFREQGWGDAHGIPNRLANAAGGVMPINAGPSSSLGSTSVPFCNVTSKWTIAIKKLLVAPRFCDHIRKHSLPQPGLKRSLCVLQQLYHCLFVSAARSARLFLWILVNRKNRGRLYSFVNFQQIDLICWPRQG